MPALRAQRMVTILGFSFFLLHAGIARAEDGLPDGHLVLADLPHQSHTWDAALQAAAELDHAGHKDWHVSTRSESALLYANVREKIDSDEWYWTSTKHSDGRAWGQDFGYGRQSRSHASFEARVRFVRRLPL